MTGNPVESGHRHVLSCGHLVQGASTECGKNCKKKGNLAPFICHTCITYEVLRGLNMITESSPIPEVYETLEYKVAVIVNEEIDEMKNQGARDCTNVRRPKKQYFSDYVRRITEHIFVKEGNRGKLA